MKRVLLCFAMAMCIGLFVVPVSAQATGQFKGQCQHAGDSYNDAIVKPYIDDPTTPEVEYALGPTAHLHNFWGNLGVPHDPSVDTLAETALYPTTCEDGSQDGGGVTRNNKGAYWAPQLYLNGWPLTPSGSGFYYSSKGALDPTVTQTTPHGLKLIARHRNIEPDPARAAEIDVSCPGGVLEKEQKLPDGKNTPPPQTGCNPGSNLDVAITFPECLDPSTLNMEVQTAYRAIGRGTNNAYCAEGLTQIPTLQMFLTYRIPVEVGPYLGPTSWGVAGPNNGILPFSHIHADYVNSEDFDTLIPPDSTREVRFCINRQNSEDPRCK